MYLGKVKDPTIDPLILNTARPLLHHPIIINGYRHDQRTTSNWGHISLTSFLANIRRLLHGMESRTHRFACRLLCQHCFWPCRNLTSANTLLLFL